jgi:hypothetical protein
MKEFLFDAEDAINMVILQTRAVFPLRGGWRIPGFQLLRRDQCRLEKGTQSSQREEKKRLSPPIC